MLQHRDLEEISSHSKICWGQTPQIMFIKPRGFVTFCHHRWRKDGAEVVVNQACEHKDAPGFAKEGQGSACRAYALRGANCEYVLVYCVLGVGSCMLCPSDKRYQQRQTWIVSLLTDTCMFVVPVHASIHRLRTASHFEASRRSQQDPVHARDAR